MYDAFFTSRLKPAVGSEKGRERTGNVPEGPKRAHAVRSLRLCARAKGVLSVHRKCQFRTAAIVNAEACAPVFSLSTSFQPRHEDKISICRSGGCPRPK